MGLFGFGKNKDDKKQTPEEISAEEASEYLKILDEVADEIETEKKEKEEENRAALMAQFEKRQEAENLALKATSDYINLAGDGRFFLLVDDLPAKEPEVKTNFLVGGTVRGTAKVGDTIYLYHARKNETTTTVIAGLKTEDGQKVDQITDAIATVEIEPGDMPLPQTPDEAIQNPIEKYSVVSNVKAGPVEGGAENPKLLGMSLEHSRFAGNNDFFQSMIEAMVHSDLVTPTQISKTTGTERKIGFLSVNDNNGNAFFPVYTDNICLNRQRPAAADGVDNKQMRLNFAQAAAMSRAGGNTGLLINAFGPMSIRLPSNLVDNITSTKLFEDEFGEAASKAVGLDGIMAAAGATIVRAPKPGPKKEMVMQPASELGEYRFMKDAVKKFCFDKSDIASVGIAVQYEKENPSKKSYICVIDCPQDKAQKYFEQISNLCKPYMKAIKTMNGMPASGAPFAKELFSKTGYAYNKLSPS